MLGRVSGGKVSRSPRIVLYGPEGVGKSTFTANAPCPISLGSEKGTDQLDIQRFPEPAHWIEVLMAVDELIENETPFRTLSLDTLDWIEPICWAYVCQQGGKKSIEEFGYGKGYIAALDQWRILLSKLDKLRDARGMTIVALAHSNVRVFNNPTGDDFDRYELKLHQKTSGLWKEWSDLVLFAQYEEFVRKTGQNKVRAMSTGARVMHTQRTAAWDAKSRYPIPDQLALDWQDLADAIANCESAGAIAIVERINRNLPKVDEETQERCLAAVAKAGNDVATLLRIDNKLASMTFQMSEQAEEQQS